MNLKNLLKLGNFWSKSVKERLAYLFWNNSSAIEFLPHNLASSVSKVILEPNSNTKKEKFLIY